MLARRELSESQIRQRLIRRGYEKADVDQAIEGLKDDRSIDDTRVATAIARTETVVRSRGKRRVMQQLEQAGISRNLARQAVADAFETLDHDVLLASAVARRLKPEQKITDERHFQRLFRFLLRQGFDPDDVFKALNARR
jgi:regulatory protein